MGNYEFGLNQVIRSLSPPQQKLAASTWNYAKRCFLSVIENLAKRLIVMKDDDVKLFLIFLKECEGESRLLFGSDGVSVKIALCQSR